MLVGMLLILALFVFIFIGIPVYVALGATGTIGLIIIKLGPGFGDPLIVIPQSIYTGIGFFPLLAIPLFIFAGEIMNKTGITDRLIRFSVMIIGRMPGSLANANIVSSLLKPGLLFKTPLKPLS